MRKINVCILFGGVSPEHAVSCRSAEAVLNHIDAEKYNIYPVGITESGKWLLFGGSDYAELPAGTWMNNPRNHPALISPVQGQGLLCFYADGVRGICLDVVFPVMHGENCEDGAIQGLLQLAGIPCVGPGVAASAVAMDKTLTKLAADAAGIRQAAWEPVRSCDLQTDENAVLDRIEKRFSYPVFVKPAGTGSSVGVSKARDRKALKAALREAVRFDAKVLVEEFIKGKEVEVAVLGNGQPEASVCGEIDSGADFYDYAAKYLTATSTAYIPARIPAAVAERVRAEAVKVYGAVGCRGLSRVDFFVTETGDVIFNEINTLPGFTSISMYPKLWEASGVGYTDLIDRLLRLAMEENA